MGSHGFPWARRVAVATILAGATAAAPGAARAELPESNGRGFDTHLFRPALDSKGLFTVNGSEIIGHNDISFGLIIDYGRNLLRVNDVGQKSPQLINHSFQGTFHLNYGLFNHLVVGLSAPVNLVAGDQQIGRDGNPSVAGWSTNALDSQSLNNLALHAKWRILSAPDGFGLALAVQAGLPTSSASRSASADPSFWYWPQLIGEKRFGSAGQFIIALNAGYRGHSVSTTELQLKDGKLQDGQRVTYGGGVSWKIDPIALVAETYGTYLLASGADSNVKLSNEVVGGLKMYVEHNSYLMLGGGARYTNGFEAADFRGFIGFIFEPSIGDRDGDGIPDDKDKCPDEPEDKDGFQDEDGCPDPDNDNDGILDVNDRCPDVPEDIDGDHDDDGCPEGGDGDRDGDGILDSKDKCPDQPEDRDGFEDEDGCPDLDNDKDGIPDKLDKCPNDPEDKDGFEDEDGCPDPDNDKDGIPDSVDKCPNQPETFNGVEDEDGCPDRGNLIIQDNNIIILEKIKFAKGSAEILKESYPIIDAVAAALKGHPEFLMLEVGGHADERGDDKSNLRLTQARVNSVLAALVQRGVAASRLRSKGYGEYCPEDPGHNEVSWEKNRRVEFKILKTSDGPTGVELGCEEAKKRGVVPEPVQ